VLEADGAVEIKFRKKDLLLLMSRCDSELAKLLHSRQEASGSEAVAAVDAAIRERQEQLLPIYHSIALHFAGMHDTPVRHRYRIHASSNNARVAQCCCSPAL
jgi:acetyl-CoA carboxylase / biotin carboxylase 1